MPGSLKETNAHGGEVIRAYQPRNPVGAGLAPECPYSLRILQQLAGTGVGKRLNEYGLDGREDYRGCADADGDGEERNHGHSGSAPQEPERVADILESRHGWLARRSGAAGRSRASADGGVGLNRGEGKR